MSGMSASDVEIHDVARGLWLWRQPHWEWREGDDWEPKVSSFVVEVDGRSILLDPLAPPPGTHGVYERLAAAPPSTVIVIKPDHLRDVDLFVHWYGAAPYGPWRWERGLAPQSDLTPVVPGDTLPGGLRALFDGRGFGETPLYLPDQRAIVFADGMTAPGGVLRVWWSPILEQSTMPALRAMLALPFEYVLVSHGDPVHGRAEFEAALDREPWSIPKTARAE